MLIDSEKLLKDIDNLFIAALCKTDKLSVENMQKVFHGIVNNQQAVAKWVKVEDRLPAEQGTYIVAYNSCYNEVPFSDAVLLGTDTFRGKTAWAKHKSQKVIAWAENLCFEEN